MASVSGMSIHAPAALLLLVLALLTGSWPRTATAQDTLLNRCVGPGGNTIYTDRPCDSIGAAARLPRGAAPGNTGVGQRRGGCARTLQDLTHAITYAIDSRDVNRLGAVYHWVGHSPESGYQVMDRLQAIVDRPLIDIVPLRATAARAETIDIGGSSPATPADTTATTTPTAAPSTADAPTPRPPSRRTPVGLRLEQTLKNGSTPARTVFGLRRHLDCWWITF